MFSLYGIIKSLKDHAPSYEEIETKALDKVILKMSDEYPFARINCKKLIGTSECADATLEEYLLKATDYLKRQILSLEPDLILCCGSRNGNNLILNFLSNNCYDLQDTEPKSYNVHYDSEKSGCHRCISSKFFSKEKSL